MHNIPDYLRITPEMQEHFANGGMIKRADGSYSRRGLWDNIRANRGSGKKPTKEMLEQEAKIRAQEQYGGIVEEYGRGGYTVKRSNARKGKTHVVIGPDGTKKYFGDSKLGQHPSDPARKKAFYARHKHNLENNPYFRAFARATWADGGYIPEYQDGTAAVDLTEVTISPRQYKELSNEELRALHNKVGRPESSDIKATIPQVIKDSIRNDVRSIKRLKKAITNSTGTTRIIDGSSVQYKGNNGEYYVLTPREAEQYNQYESNLPWYKNLWYNVATRDIPEGSRLANYDERQGAYMNNYPYVYTDTNQDATQLNTPVVYKGKTYTTPFIVNPEEESSIYYSDGTMAPSNHPVTNNSTEINPQWVAQMQQQGFRNGGNYGPFYNRRDAAKMQRWRTPNANSMTPHFDVGGLNELEALTGNSGQGINTTSPAWSPSISPVATTPNITTAGLDKQNQNQFTMDEKQITTKSPTDDTKMQPGADVTNLLKNSSPLGPMDTTGMISKGLSQLSNSMSSGLAATNILSRTFGNSEQNALLDFNRKQDNPTNYLNKVSNFAGIQYAKDGGTIGQYKEGDEIELTPTQMYLLEKKGYKFQII